MRKAVSWHSSRKTKQAKTASGRNLLHEQSLCKAIHGRNTVDIRYEAEVVYRTFEPHAVYRATTENVLVTGLQTKNPMKPFDKTEIHNFTVGKIVDVRILDTRIATDATVDRSDDRFKRGIICSI